MRNKGFTLLEVLVATILVSLVLVGLASIFIAGRRYIMHTRARMTSGELGRVFLEPLQSQVRQDTWGQAPPNNLLTPGNYRSPNNPCSDVSGYTVVASYQEPIIDGITYYPSYQIIDLGNNLRKVVVKLCWSEPAP